MTKRIVTGQQIGLLGGPLYTAYKVLGAARRGEELSGEAIYWLETNDADFNEINHIDYLDNDGRLRTLTWDIDSGGASCGLIRIEDTLPELLEIFFDTLRQTEFTPGLKKLALECYLPGRTLGEASLILAKELYAEFPLRFFDPVDGDFRGFSRPILLREAEKTPIGEQCNLFVMDGDRRRAIFRSNDGYRFRDGTGADIEGFSLVPNVYTRSVCQDAYFGTDEYIAGPGEKRYLQEMASQFEFHGVRAATVVPRMSVTLLEPKVSRLLKKTGLTLKDVAAANREELIARVLRQQSGFDMRETVEEALRLTDLYLNNVAQLGLDAGEMRKVLYNEVKAAAGRRRAREKERHRELLRVVHFLSDALMPFGKRQERVFNLFYYMNLYGGKDFVRWLYRHYDWQAEVLEVANA